MAAEAYVTSEDVADFLNKPLGWLYANAESLGIPRYKLGRQYRYRLSEVAEWLSNQA